MTRYEFVDEAIRKGDGAMLTRIQLLSESDAMQALGMRSAGRWCFSVMGERAHEMIRWVEAQPLPSSMDAHWTDSRLIVVYLMFERAAHSELSQQAINSALTVFIAAFKDVDGWQWMDSGIVPKATKVF